MQIKVFFSRLFSITRILAFSFLSVSIAVQATTVELVADINTDGSSYSGSPASLTPFNGKLYFEADNGVTGRELYVYDGVNQPRIVADLRSGGGGSIPRYLTEFNGKLYFQANDGSSGSELFVYDGTSTPSLVADIYVGTNASSPANLTVFNNKLYFSANDGINYGNELYVYDGINPPALVADINPGTNIGSNPAYLTVFNNKLYFQADNGVNGSELFEFDGTNAPILVADIRVGVSGSGVEFLTEYNNKLYFSADDGVNGEELFEFDGTNAPSIVADINPGLASGLPMELTVFNNKLYFSVNDGVVGHELYVYDGTNAPSLVADIYSGVNYSEILYITEFNNKLFFQATDGVNGNELFVYDGTNLPTLVADIKTGNSGSYPSDFAALNTTLYFVVDDGIHGTELYQYDGNNPPSLVADIHHKTSGSSPSEFYEFQGKLYFQANDSVNGNELYQYDGTNTPSLVADISNGTASSSPGEFVEFNNKLYFQASDGTNGFELFEYDAINPPNIVADINSGASSSFPEFLVVFNSKLYFRAENGVNGGELYEYDGTNSPSLVGDIYPGIGHGGPSYLTVFNNKLYFSANDGVLGAELYVYDGVNPPSLVFDINNGSNESAPSYLTVFNNKLYFAANNGTTGQELFEYDGINPPSLVADIWSGSPGSSLSNFTVLNNRLYFSADDGVNGRELFVYDGINPPNMLADLNSGIGGSFPNDLIVLNDSLFFSAYEIATGTELYLYDGVNPPRLAVDIYSGSSSSSPRHLTVINNKLVFQATQDTYGIELYAAIPNSAPTISGSPATSVAENLKYDFTPISNDIDGDSLTFSIANKPSWANFNNSSGRLFGTPGRNAAGVYNNIAISVSDGTAPAVVLPSFAINVSAYYNEDFDNDGLTNEQEDNLGTDIFKKDTDNDGINDAQDDLPLDSTETIDTDNDGIGNNADIDDDNDGIVDEDDAEPLNEHVGDDQAPVIGDIDPIIIEATGPLTDVSLVSPEVSDNNINQPTISSDYSGPLALGEYIINWTATDYAGNQTIQQQKLEIVDTTAPIIEAFGSLTLNAKGRLTDISSDLNIQAFDLVDGELTVSPLSGNRLLAGKHDIELIATDLSGNEVLANLSVSITPEVQIPKTVYVAPGGKVKLPVILSGTASEYPVEVRYGIDINGEVTEQSSISITAGTEQLLFANIPSEVSEDDVVTLNLLGASNAFIGHLNQLQFIVINNNVAPRLELQVRQNNSNVAIIDPENGMVTISATIEDINSEDQHDIFWQAFSSELTDANNSLTYEFDPSELVEGIYAVDIIVTESNTEDALSITQRILLFVEHLPELSTELDSDADGLKDSEEGYADNDGDGILDYIDNDNAPIYLPIGNAAAPIQTTPGLNLSLGPLVRVSMGSDSQYGWLTMAELANLIGEYGADTRDAHFEFLSPIFHFTIDGLAQVGDSAAVVIPLSEGQQLPEGAVYRKYNTIEGWFSFIDDGKNSISSSKIDENGNCPVPGHVSYTTGLTAGDNCVQVLIEDGGANDFDLRANGSVTDPGVIAIEKINQAPVIDLPTSIDVNEQAEITIDASNTMDAEGDSLAFQWTQLSGTTVELADYSTSILVFNSPSVTQNETLVFELSVDDGFDKSKHEIEVVVHQVNQVPTIVINNHNNSVSNNDTLIIKAVARDDDGDVLSYSWEQISGPIVSFESNDTPQILVTIPNTIEAGLVKIQLTVSDGNDIAVATTQFEIEREQSGGGSMGILLFVLLWISLVKMRFISVGT